ncbi:hypothetical protein ACFPVY_03985 [Flavobacterium qiangtangense]|uniref:Uncharacterized protein n=1 Tax=Flavobacterium qiangtangense TaxID=1442595 RepID=A0ABW1PJL0_9FLAO
MENYNIQFKIAKKLLEKTRDEDVQWKNIRDLIAGKKAEITVFEMNEDDTFEKPNGHGNFPEWKAKVGKDIYVEFSTLLTEKQAERGSDFYLYIDKELEKKNGYLYIWEDEKSIHVSTGHFIFENFIEPATTEKKVAPKKVENKQIDMFKRTPKSK